MQVWLVLLGAVLLWRADECRIADLEHQTVALMLLGYGCLIVSIILVFVNGGTTG